MTRLHPPHARTDAGRPPRSARPSGCEKSADPFPIIDTPMGIPIRPRRFVRPAPAEFIRQVRSSDVALNAIRRRREIFPRWAKWLAVAISAPFLAHAVAVAIYLLSGASL